MVNIMKLTIDFDASDIAILVTLLKEVNKALSPVTVNNVVNSVSETIEPDWTTAPQWANYWAVDTDGYSWWYENKPHYDDSFWYDIGSKEEDTLYYSVTDWKSTLRKRPKR